ncbi:MAG: tRNA (5-methylaminomethyl-2-thiouridine)(34)-methyltransferase MnmD [Phenylobacterium sp.]|uniref:tRNA (5-methylaminomethyl-2-thiouridine)(34)-methyltransferase MnmD n=1 Tax=Phenylobacterium sp. TaxID=1871053 RepID=UPI001B6EF9E9|nr:tRNA (5-methylaminomethyl-2-thiouridine)(34)-methyltransferase MnmD [Phenylobacterium sp.]MBP7650695.1 tRNA (5-methylaminomethyl-2-thiouridine)(34)-methyltransferase MnmD [Phenylobacterium sp.]MBP7816462.1 tRNA (5-methylaminomethyl-2-thiouridine)(34)-methyltransferase MnmD [Phenylobacterium sp.]MBP9232258.1 tRNA (5-methylaminomethyl-2-thiouridine)(34)-methyltransferase MnmD [Phenylobacterium sp.]MBP9754696.1 tRNA (5-methylaminomethyl-2-thiouridine)(34)-methyltransferase MnmD [Phenylobacteriu
MSDQTPSSPLLWADDGQPRSRLYGDVYFSTEDGLAESRAVFLTGCGLPAAWAGRDRFVVGELGFGTGLNILALLDLWRTTHEPGAHLHIFSVEAHPLSADEARRALAAWPELADLARLLTDRWPGQARGLHRVELPEASATLDLAVMDAHHGLEGWQGRADAWFLDGFSPALNPDMWDEALLALVAARSAPGARAATFTVAGAVRRGLLAAGFIVEKRPGHGRKRERLEASLPGVHRATTTPRVAIVGAGIAGAAAARALRTLGCKPILIEAQTAGAGASGNPAALVTPRLDAGLGPLAALFAQAYGRALRLYEGIPDAILSRGVLQLADRERDLGRFAKIAAADLFEPGALLVRDLDEASARMAEPVPAALDMTGALVISPAAVLEAWCGEVLRATVAGLHRSDGVWRLSDADGGTVAQAEAVILATGHQPLWSQPEIRPVRGQASWTRDGAAIPAAAWGGYVLPTQDGLLFGATHDRDDVGSDVREADHDRNRAALADALPQRASRLEGLSLEGRASVRATTADRLPLAGAAPQADAGLFLLGGFGSRGFCLAPLLAEHVAALALGAPSPLPAGLTELVDPARFLRRAARRGGASIPAPAR